jgi:hypothetical protein
MNTRIAKKVVKHALLMSARSGFIGRNWAETTHAVNGRYGYERLARATSVLRRKPRQMGRAVRSMQREIDAHSRRERA